MTASGKRLLLRSLADTQKLGAAIAAALIPGDAVLLSGDLGAGKTELARALLRAACGDPALEVPSPTYTLVQTYDAPKFPIAHFDLWRLAAPADLTELGFEDARDGVVIVEWPDRLAVPPRDALCLHLQAVGAARDVTATGWPGRLPLVIAALTGETRA